MDDDCGYGADTLAVRIGHTVQRRGQVEIG